MNKVKGILIFSLICVLVFSTVGTFGVTNVKATQLKDEQVNFNIDSSDFVVLEDGVLVGGKFYSPWEFEEYLKSAEIVVLSGSDDGPQFFFALAPAVYLVPGVGQVTLLATGAILVGGATIEVGSWLYDIISNFFNDPKDVIASNYGIPKSLLDSNGYVELGSFKDKYGSTPLTKNSGTFKNGRWTIDKDTAGHSERRWKLKKDGQRKASLDKNGKVLSK